MKYHFTMAPTGSRNKKQSEESHGKKKSKGLKHKIRGVKRLLEQPDLPATVRVAQERMLQMLEDNMKEKTSQDSQKKYDKKYKMVKFFEKRKSIRKYNQCCKLLQNCPEEERSELEREIEKIKDNINYITYYPTDCRYISLYPPQPYTDSAIIKQQETISSMIRSKISEGKLKDALEIVKNTDDLPIKEAQRLKRTVDKREKSRTKKTTQVQMENPDDKQGHHENEEAEEGSFVDDFFLDSTSGTNSQQQEVLDMKSSQSSRKANPKFIVLGLKEKRKRGESNKKNQKRMGKKKSPKEKTQDT